MPESTNEEILKALIAAVELPDSAYEKAKERYEDLGQWLSQPSSGISKYSPHILPQGSFRFGTAVRPVSNEEEYDLDITCRLENGLAMENITQAELRSLVKKDMEAYRKERGLQAPLGEKHRCFRLEYQDHLSFHMDIVPCIPDSPANRELLIKAYNQYSYSESFIRTAIPQSSRITDDRHGDYQKLSSNWLVSNPEGYARWFEDRMLSVAMLKSFQERAQVDALPIYRKRVPLQRAIQILKRHRDTMFRELPESRPISIIITTLAAQAYHGEDTLESALSVILSGMEGQIRPQAPKVPNPVNPSEDFADKWDKPEYAHLHLEDNFKTWVMQAKADFHRLISSVNAEQLQEYARSFLVSMERSEAVNLTKSRMPIASSSTIIIPKDPPRPWMEKWQ